MIRGISLGYHTDDLCYNSVNNRIYAVGGNLVSVIDARADTMIRWLYLGEEVQGGLVWDSIDNLVYVSLTDHDSLAVIDGAPMSWSGRCRHRCGNRPGSHTIRGRIWFTVRRQAVTV